MGAHAYVIWDDHSESSLYTYIPLEMVVKWSTQWIETGTEVSKFVVEFYLSRDGMISYYILVCTHNWDERFEALARILQWDGCHILESLTTS